MSKNSLQAASFRDPSGFLFWKEGILYRQVNASYKQHYDNLMESGLYDSLVKKGALISHAEVEMKAAQSEIAYKTLAPEVLPFISYPYEWSFSQLKDAAIFKPGNLHPCITKGNGAERCICI